MPSPIPVLRMTPLATAYLTPLVGRYEIIAADDPAAASAALDRDGHRIRAVVAQGSLGVTAADITRMPRLEVICTIGAGYEGIDMAAAAAREIAVANARGANADCVADHAFTLLASALREVSRLDRGVRDGAWRDRLLSAPPSQITGRRVGILGMGDIGRRIMRRCAGFDMPIAYSSRRPHDDLPHPWFATPRELARWAECLIVATPGDASTFHLIDEAVLADLGAHGVLVNIARGSVVDTTALGQALRTGAIAAAAIDVYEGEPAAPAELLGLPNITITPHVAGLSPEARAAAGRLVRDNLEAHFAGLPLLTPVHDPRTARLSPPR